VKLFAAWQLQRLGCAAPFSNYYFLPFELLRPLGRREMKKCKMGFSPKCISALAIIE
jgi:hypothetical protein